jgi:hypothetical protein
MAKDRGVDDQMDSDEELLNFELDDLSLSEDSDDDLDTDEDIIELVDLVERGSAEDITRGFKAGDRAGGPTKEIGIVRLEADRAQEDDEAVEPELDLSDLSFEPDMETGGEKEGGPGPDAEITDADLKGLLQDDDGITLDFSEEDDLEQSEIFSGEISDADLQALLSEKGEEDIEEEEEEFQPLELSAEQEQEMQLEYSDETQTLHLKSALEEKILEAEPADLLGQEVEKLGAETELEEEEGALPEEELLEPGDTAESEVLSIFDEQSGEEETEDFKEESLAGLTEERMEEIITNVVREVVERVARETMAEVAERMIGEAIETLKQSLEVSER